MKSQILPRIFLLFFASFFLSSNFSVIHAQVQEYDPTSEYTVHSVPVITGETKVDVVTQQDLNSTKTIDQEQLFLSTQGKSSEKSLFSKFGESFSNGLSSLKNSVTFVFQNTMKGIQTGIVWLGQKVQSNWKDILTAVAVFAILPLTGFIIANHPWVKGVVQNIFKNASDFQARIIGAVSVVLITSGLGLLITKAYTASIGLIEHLTGWKLGPIQQGVIITGLVALVAVTGFFIVKSGVTALAVKSTAASLAGLLPNWKKLGDYFLSETKSAFTETEKECKESVEKCSSLFDKVVILFFNYLPGSMPDLGMDDFIINLKNKLFGKPAVQKQK